MLYDVNRLKGVNRLKRMKAPDDPGAGGDGGAAVSGSDAGGGSPSGGDSVSSSPDAGSGVSPATPASPDSDPWGGLGLDHSSDDEIEIPPAPPAPAAPPAAPQVPAQTTPPTQPQAQPAAPQTTQTQTQAAPGAPAPAAELSPSDPAGIAEALQANRAAVISHLAQAKFALTQEEVTELETDASAAIPKLLARVHTDTLAAVYQFLGNAIPGMIQRFNAASSANSEAENRFFTTHQALGLDAKNTLHRETATRLAKLYRGMNPDVPLDQMIADLGPMVAKAVGATPAAPRAPAPGQPIPNAPAFRPAVNGGGMIPQPAGDENPWSGLGQDFD